MLCLIHDEISDLTKSAKTFRTHFKSSCDQSLDKTSFDFSNIFHAVRSCAMNAKSSIIPKLPMGMVT